MKTIQSIVFMFLLLGFIACQQNKPAPTPAPPPNPDAQNGGTDEDDPNIVYVKTVGMVDAGAVVPDPRRTSYAIDHTKDGNLQPIYLTYIEEGGGQKRTESRFSLTAASSVTVIDLMEKIGAIKETEFKPKGSQMVGKGPKTYTIGRSDGSTPRKIEVFPGSTADASLIGLDAFVAAEMAAFNESQGGPATKTAAFLEGKVWQSNTDPDLRISFRDGKQVTFRKEKEEPAHCFFSFRKWCPDDCGFMTKKNEGQGMKAGFICCVTLTAQDDVCYLVLDAQGNEFSYVRADDPKAKVEEFTLLTRK
jgi:hypothetical protein